MAQIGSAPVRGPSRSVLYVAGITPLVLPQAGRGLPGDFVVAPPRYQSDFARRHYAEGEAKGQAKGVARAILLVLDARGIEVSAAVREEIAGCTELEQLLRWARRAATAIEAHDLFD